MIDNQSDSGPVIVGVDGSERSVEALALSDLLGLEREVAESTFERICEYLLSVAERRMQVVAGESPAAGLHALAVAEGATLIVVGSSHTSAIGRILVAETGDVFFPGCGARRGRPGRLRHRRRRYPDSGVWLRRFAGVASCPRLGSRTRKDDIGAATRAQRL